MDVPMFSLLELGLTWINLPDDQDSNSVRESLPAPRVDLMMEDLDFLKEVMCWLRSSLPQLEDGNQNKIEEGM